MGAMRRSWSWGWGLLAAGATLGFACGNPDKPGAGGDEAGAGQGGSPANGDFDPCEVGDLAEHCADGNCPESPDAVTPFCTADDFRGTTRSATECGGTVVSLNFGLGKTDYYFDEDGALIGVRSLSDKGLECSDGRTSLVTQYGETCAAVREPEDLCASPCEPQELEEGCAAHGCPDAPEDVEPYCRAHHRTLRTATACGGTVVTLNLGVGATDYYFDENAKLVGIVSTSDVEQSCPDGRMTAVTQYGESCAALGESEDVCLGPLYCDQTGACGVRGPSVRDCPDTIESLSTLPCDDALRYERFASSCGGTVIAASDGLATVRYTFDEAGELVGTVATDDTDTLRCWGSSCEPEGEPEVLCPGAGGAGGTGGAG